jgi:Flp pilus assembly protein TadD
MAFARTPFPERAWAALARVNALDPEYAARVTERYAASVEADPADLEARFRLAVGFYFRGRREAARQQLQQIVARAPKNAWALTYLGWLQTEAGHLDQAIGLWQKAISADPDLAMAHWLLGQAHFRKGRSGPAAQALRKAQTLRQAHPLALK